LQIQHTALFVEYLEELLWIEEYKKQGKRL